MIDLVKLTLQAGSGGDGKVSFRREKYVTKGGPDGGDGGDGGHVLIRSQAGLTTLRDLAGLKKVEAGRGKNGGQRKKFGERGQDKVITVPVGTVLWLQAENAVSALRRQKYGFVNAQGEQQLLRRADLDKRTLSAALATADIAWTKYWLEKEGQPIPKREALSLLNGEQQLADLQTGRVELFTFTAPDQEIVVCQGGFGGLGNTAFKSSTHTTPYEAEYGSFGEVKVLELELRLLADVALVGLPNAGKSTFLSKVTKANPKIANYPFTTLEPNLGILYLGKGQGKEELIIADIPGLVEGASQGKGLGLDFLRHIKNCQALMYVLHLPEEVIFDPQLTEKAQAELLWQQYQDLRGELKTYDSALISKPRLLTINKLDLYTTKQIETFRSYFRQKKENVIVFSGFTGEKLREVTTALAQLGFLTA